MLSASDVTVRLRQGRLGIVRMILQRDNLKRDVWYCNPFGDVKKIPDKGELCITRLLPAGFLCYGGGGGYEFSGHIPILALQGFHHWDCMRVPGH